MTIILDKETLRVIQIIRNYLDTDYIFVTTDEIMVSKIPYAKTMKENFQGRFIEYLKEHNVHVSDFELTKPNIKLGWSISMDRFYPCPKDKCGNDLSNPLDYGGHRFMHCSKCKGWYNLSKEPPVLYENPLRGVNKNE